MIIVKYRNLITCSLLLVCTFLEGCSMYSPNSSSVTDITKPSLNTTDFDATQPSIKAIDLIDESNISPTIAATEVPFAIAAENEMKNDIPWGFDETSYALYLSGSLDKFIPKKSEVDQCVIADLDMDNIDDVLLSVSIPESIKSSSAEDIYNYELNTIILKGLGDRVYQIIAENPNINYFSSYDCSSSITAGCGWFKFCRASGKAGGYEYVQLFKYDKEKKDWFYAEDYYNRFGYIEQGISKITTPTNFGVISFKEYGEVENNTSTNQYTNLEVNTETVKISINCEPELVTFQDKEKEQKINNLIIADLVYIVNSFIKQDVPIDILLTPTVTFQTPDIVSIEYYILGKINSTEINYSGINRKYFTTTIDINSAERIRLSDIIDANKLIDIIKESGLANMDAKMTIASFNNMPESNLVKLIKSSDDLTMPFSSENTGVFCTLYEKSLCLYFQPTFFGLGPYCEEPKLFIPINNILPYARLNYWSKPSEAAEHIEWRG